MDPWRLRFKKITPRVRTLLFSSALMTLPWFHSSLAQQVSNQGQAMDPAAVLLASQGWYQAAQSSSNPNSCDALGRSNGGLVGGIQTAANGSTGAGNAFSAVAGGLGDSVNTFARSRQRGASSGAALTCLASSSAGACAVPTAPVVPEEGQCTDLVDSQGREKSLGVNRFRTSLDQYLCALQCREQKLRNTQTHLGCIAAQVATYGNDMNRLSTTLSQILAQQQGYVNFALQEAAKQDSIQQFFDQKKEDLRGALDSVQGVYTKSLQQGPGFLTKVREFQRAQTYRTQAVETARVQRISACLQGQGPYARPAGFPIQSCRGENNQLIAAGSAYEGLFCAYQQRHGGAVSGRSASLARSGSFATSRTEALLKQEVGESSTFHGDGILRVPGSENLLDVSGGGSGGEQAGAQSSAGASAPVTLDQLRSRLAGALGAAPVDTEFSQGMTALLAACTRQADQTMTQEASQGSQPQRQWSDALDRRADGIVAELGPFLGEADQGMRQATNSLYPGQASGQSSSFDACGPFQAGGTSSRQYLNESRLSGCITQVQNASRCLLEGTQCPSGARMATQLSGPYGSGVSCVGLRQCTSMAELASRQAQSIATSARGDGTFPCSYGQCPGKNTFLRQANQSVDTGVRLAAQGFNRIAQGVNDQLLLLNSNLRALGLDPKTFTPGRSEGSGATNSWSCSGGGGSEGSSSGAGAEPQLCSMPQPDLASVLSGRTNPPQLSPHDLGELLNQVSADVNSKLEELQEKGTQSEELARRFNTVLQGCQSQVARDRARALGRRISALVRQCHRSGTESSIQRNAVCGDSKLRSLNNDMAEIQRVLDHARGSGSDASDALDEAQTAQGDLEDLCGRERGVGAYREGTEPCSMPNESNRALAAGQRACGSDVLRAAFSGGAAAGDRASHEGTSVEPDHNRDEYSLSKVDNGQRITCIMPGRGSCSNLVGYAHSDGTGRCEKICPSGTTYDQEYSEGSSGEDNPERAHCKPNAGTAPAAAAAPAPATTPGALAEPPAGTAFGRAGAAAVDTAAVPATRSATARGSGNRRYRRTPPIEIGHSNLTMTMSVSRPCLSNFWA